MNLLYGEVLEVSSSEGLRTGKVRVGGALRTVVLDFVPNAACGDRVLLCDGVAIGKVDDALTPENPHVPRNPR
jgi:hydrogenase maturation factor